jgi:DNA-directed RNA polymerase subunit alpha
MHIIQEEIGLPKIVPQELGDNHVVFTIAPLPPGYGMTLGNALRRVLLSSLPGAAAAGVKIKGVSHEYSTISGVKESVLDILLNLKKLQLSKDNKESGIIKLKKTGPGDVLAKHFECPSDIKILNPNLYITSLNTKSSTIEMEVMVEKGVGYLPAKLQKSDDAGLIQIDANFSPLKRIRYDVDYTRVGQMTNLDKLTMEIETSGAIAPEDALKFAANILKSYYDLFDMDEIPVESDFISDYKQIMAKATEEEQSTPSQEAYTPIEILGLSPRTLNSLINGGIGSIEQLVKCSEAKLTNLRGFGKKALTEVEDALSTRDLKLDCMNGVETPEA